MSLTILREFGFVSNQPQELHPPSCVTENSVQNPLVSLGGYISNHTYVSAAIGSPAQNLPFFIPLGPEPLLYNFVWSALVIELDDEHENAKRATFFGIILPQDLGEGLTKVVDRYYCNAGFLYTAAKSEIAALPKYSDMSADSFPGFQNPDGTCNGISFAIEFDLVRVHFSEVDPDPHFVPYPCPQLPRDLHDLLARCRALGLGAGRVWLLQERELQAL